MVLFHLCNYELNIDMMSILRQYVCSGNFTEDYLLFIAAISDYGAVIDRIVYLGHDICISKDIDVVLLFHIQILFLMSKCDHLL